MSSYVIQWVPSALYNSALPVSEDPFRHKAGANSHNHHELHPWGDQVVIGSKEFDSMYAEANNAKMYHLWYHDGLAPFMATELLKAVQLSKDLQAKLIKVLWSSLRTSQDDALDTEEGKSLISDIQILLDDATKGCRDGIFVRLGATSAKDSFAKGAPTTKPGPLPPQADVVIRRLFTSGRVVGRLLALSENVWGQDPGEALLIQRWSPQIKLEHELRVFCCRGRVTAISQDIWWEKNGWRERYSEGLVETIIALWEDVKIHLPFDTCTMDVLTTPPMEGAPRWKAKVIEFNSFGPHLNTGSDLFHWVVDFDTLHGRNEQIVVRFVDDFEEDPEERSEEDLEEHSLSGEDTVSVSPTTDTEDVILEESEPDWMVLEREIRAKYVEGEKDKARLDLEENFLPLGRRWCSAY